MGSNVAGTSTFWATIFEYLDGEPVFWDGLYKRGIRRLSDRTMWLVDETVRILSRLASVDAGTKATISGSVDLTTLTYDPVAGDLNGKTLILDGDVGAAQTVTLGTGGTAPATPADVVTQILAQTTNKTAVLDSSSRLSVGSTTVGALSTIEVVGGTGAALLGLPLGTATGSGTMSDGASRIGFGEFGTIGATTVRAVLEQLTDGTLSFSFPPSFARPAAGLIRLSNDSITMPWMYNHPIPADGYAYQALELPNGAEITQIDGWIAPPVDGTLPGTKPAVALIKVAIATGASTTVDTASDASGLAAYEQLHAIELTLGTPLTIDNDQYVYYASIAGEQGANKTAIEVGGFVVHYTVPTPDYA